ncbi:MFS transporter [Brachybacterium sp. UNK5269]|uniref:MFS transporter n=1 Tax=Brachybacterium sp. UNK5269 TaxID=3408576 RepID=UPI003BB05098
MRALVISGMILIAATYGLARFGYGLFLPQLTEAFAITPAVSGLIQAGSFFSYCVAALLATRLGHRPRRLVVLAGATAAVGAAGVAAAPTAGVLALSVVLAGAGAGFATPGLVTLLERNLPPARQEAAQPIVNAGTGAGIVAAGALLVLTAEQWRAGWAAIAVIALLAMLATLRSDRSAAVRADGPPAGTGRGLLAPLAAPLCAAALAGAASAAIWTFGRSVMEASREGAAAYSVMAWMVLGACGVLGAGAGRIVQAGSLRRAWAATTLAMALATVVLGAAPGVTAAGLLAAALFGASYTALSGVLIIWAVRTLPDRAATGTVWLFIALAVGQAAGSVAWGALLGATSPALTFGAAGIVGLLAVAPTLRRPTARKASGSGPGPRRHPSAAGSSR